MAHSRYSLNGYFHPMTKGDLVCQKLWAQAWGSDTAVEQLDAHVGGRSRRDVGRRALRPTSDPVGHREQGGKNHKQATAASRNHRENGNCQGPRDVPQRPPSSSLQDWQSCQRTFPDLRVLLYHPDHRGVHRPGTDRSPAGTKRHQASGQGLKTVDLQQKTAATEKE